MTTEKIACVLPGCGHSPHREPCRCGCSGGAPRIQVSRGGSETTALVSMHAAGGALLLAMVDIPSHEVTVAAIKGPRIVTRDLHRLADAVDAVIAGTWQETPQLTWAGDDTTPSEEAPDGAADQ
jgi:hypothetical protein